MSAYRRNVMVGVVVLAALGLLAWMLMKFGATVAIPFAPAQFPVTFTTDRADGLSDGSAITYRGLQMGRIENVRLSDDRKQVVINALIDMKPALPANVEGVIRPGGLIGGSSTLQIDLTEGEPTGELKPGSNLKARYTGSDLFPPQVVALAGEMQQTLKSFREAGLVDNVNRTVVHADEFIVSAQKYVSDPKIRENIEASIAQVRTLTEQANKVAQQVETLTQNLNKLTDETTAGVKDARNTLAKADDQFSGITKQVNERMLQVGKLLDQFQTIATKVNEGKGTAGQLVNDPRLYEGLVDTTRELNATVKDLKRLVEQWEQEGVQLKLR